MFSVFGWRLHLSTSMVLIGSVVFALAAFELAALVLRATTDWLIPRTLAARGRALSLGEFVAVGVSSLLNLLQDVQAGWSQASTQRLVAEQFRWTARHIVRRAPGLARARGADVARSRCRAAGVASILIGLSERLSDVRNTAEYDTVCADVATLAVDASRGNWTTADAAPERRTGRHWLTWPVAARLLTYLVVAGLLWLFAGSVPEEIIFGSQVTLLIAALATVPWSDTPAPRSDSSATVGEPGPQPGQPLADAQHQSGRAARSRRRR